MPTILSGKELSARLCEENLIPRVGELKKRGRTPKLCVMLIGDDPASAVYVGQKEKLAQKIGIEGDIIRLGADTPEADVLQKLEELNADTSVHGIIVQSPFPEHISPEKVLSTLNPAKDVDGFTAQNCGNLFLGKACLPSCTPQGVMTLLKEYNVELSGKHAVVVGRSNHVGKPVGLLLLQENATVTYGHSRTKNLADITRQADILVVAMGKPKFITTEHVKEGAVVVDVGIHRLPEGGLCGDTDFEAIAPKVSAITPVPGGVGPMTVYTLMENTLRVAEAG